jgi:hypothetical protein
LLLFVKKIHVILQIVVYVLKLEMYVLNVLINIMNGTGLPNLVLFIPVNYKTVKNVKQIPKNVNNAWMVWLLIFQMEDV